MAVVAIVAARDVVGGLADRQRIVVAASTSTDDLEVIDLLDWRKSHDCVAILADIRRGNVRRGLADGLDVIVAADAVPDDIVMIEIGG